MYGLKTDIIELWAYRASKAQYTLCTIYVDSVSGQLAHHVKISSKQHSEVC